MGSTITALMGTGEGAGGINLNGMWGAVSTAVPLIALCVLFGFGFRFVKKLIKRITKGTGGA